MRNVMRQRLADLRYEPTEKRVRALLGDRAVVDSTRALLIWEPRRVVPSYAVPVDDIDAELAPAPAIATTDGPLILHPGIPFSRHSTEGEPLTLRAGDETREQAAFRPSDPDLAGYAVLDFRAFDAWYEEEERVVGHPRDPFHRVDIRPGSRHVRVELDGRLLAESTRPTLVFETGLPTRFYLPQEDLRAEARPSERKTYCAYKGEASYWSFEAGKDLAWTYRQPLPEAIRLAGLVAFFDELVDIIVDGERRERPRTAVAKAVVEEALS